MNVCGVGVSTRLWSPRLRFLKTTGAYFSSKSQLPSAAGVAAVDSTHLHVTIIKNFLLFIYNNMSNKLINT